MKPSSDPPGQFDAFFRESAQDLDEDFDAKTSPSHEDE
jgi:hypothetical protein